MLRLFFLSLRTAGLIGGLCLLGALPLWAQQEPGSGGPAPGNPPDPTAVPLDGGASLLAAAAGAYGLRALRRRSARPDSNGRTP